MLGIPSIRASSAGSIGLATKNRLWYCQQVFDAPTEQAAVSASPPNTNDVRIGGCGVPANNFEWTSLVKILP
jgi:hypothetical protein